MLEEALAQSVKPGRLLRPRVRIVDDSVEAEHERGEVVNDGEAPREGDELPVDSELFPRRRCDGADGLLEALPDRVHDVAVVRRCVAQGLHGEQELLDGLGLLALPFLEVVEVELVERDDSSEGDEL